MAQVQLTKQENPTQLQSLNVVSNLLRTTISSVTYLRLLFNDDHFEEVAVAGQKFKTLKRNASKEANDLLDWLELGCFEALEKKYLKTLIFGIYADPKKPEELLESYTFRFSYPAEGGTSMQINSSGKNYSSNNSKNPSPIELVSKKDILRATTQMLRRLTVMTQSLKMLPENTNNATQPLQHAFFIIMLTYCKIFKLDYEPPCFSAGDGDKLFYFGRDAETITLGSLKTGFHSVDLCVETAANISCDKDDENIKDLIEGSEMDIVHCSPIRSSDISQDTVLLNSGQIVEATTFKSSSYSAQQSESTQELVNLLCEKEHRLNGAERLHSLGEISVDLMEGVEQEIIVLQEESKSIEKNVCCPCEVNNQVDHDMIHCSSCNTWGHLFCFGFKNSEDFRIPEKHNCYNCLNTLYAADKENNNQKKHSCFDLKKQSDISKYRRAIGYIWVEGFESIEKFCGTSLNATQKLFNNLVNDGFLALSKKIRTKGKEVYYVPKNKKTRELYEFYFSSKSNCFVNSANEKKMKQVKSSSTEKKKVSVVSTKLRLG
ncbi:HORMA domain-containing protein 1 [Lobulomyces angularis]|nr:HORMA domain-containing protein 1 [Lobulomyces angularis]